MVSFTIWQWLVSALLVLVILVLLFLLFLYS